MTRLRTTRSDARAPRGPGDGEAGAPEPTERMRKALRLLGCTVFLSGIAAEVATTLVQLGIGLEGITAVRNPQDALTRFGKMSKSTPQAGVDADAGAMV